MRILDDVDLVLVLYISWFAKNDRVDIKQLVGVCVLQVSISQFDNGEIQLCVYSDSHITTYPNHVCMLLNVSKHSKIYHGKC